MGFTYAFWVRCNDRGDIWTFKLMVCIPCSCFTDIATVVSNLAGLTGVEGKIWAWVSLAVTGFVCKAIVARGFDTFFGSLWRAKLVYILKLWKQRNGVMSRGNLLTTE